MHFLTQWLLSSRSDVSSDRFTFKIILVETWVRSEKFTFKICMSWHFDTSTHYLNYRPCCFCLNIDTSVVFFASDSFSSIYCAPEATKSSPHVAPVKKVFQHCWLLLTAWKPGLLIWLPVPLLYFCPACCCCCSTLLTKKSVMNPDQ